MSRPSENTKTFFRTSRTPIGEPGDRPLTLFITALAIDMAGAEPGRAEGRCDLTGMFDRNAII